MRDFDAALRLQTFASRHSLARSHVRASGRLRQWLLAGRAGSRRRSEQSWEGVLSYWRRRRGERIVISEIPWDTLTPDEQAALEQLRAHGLEVEILSGTFHWPGNGLTIVITHFVPLPRTMLPGRSKAPAGGARATFGARSVGSRGLRRTRTSGGSQTAATNTTTSRGGF